MSRALLNYLMEDRTEKPHVKWIWGNITNSIDDLYEKYGAENIYHKDSTKWWDGYEQEKVILITKFDRDWFQKYFPKLADHGPCQFGIRRGSVKINSPFVYIIVDKNVDDLIKNLPANDQLRIKRRIDEIIHID